MTYGLVSLRRSSRLRPKLPTLKASDEFQSLLDQRGTDLQPSQLATTSPYTPGATSHPTRKRRYIDSEIKYEGPPKRANLTAKNLKALEAMGRGRRSTGKKSLEESSTTTTTDKDFGPQLQRNHVVFASIDARAPTDIDRVRESLDKPRESEPPDDIDYQRYLVTTEGYQNEATIQASAYPLLAKRASPQVEISGYSQRINYTWSEVDNPLTTGLSCAKPDITESYRKTDYPPQVVDTLSGALAPTMYDIAMPAFAVELKSSDGSIAEAKLQCAFDGALITKGAHYVHRHMQKPDDAFYGTTQAITAAYNGDSLNFYVHHALSIPGKSRISTSEAAGNGNSADAEATLEYHQYLLSCDNPRASPENFRMAHKHMRNAQEFCYKLATEKRDALWTCSKTSTSRTQTNIPITLPESSSNNILSVSPQEAPQPNARKARRRVADDGPSAVVCKPKARRSARTCKIDVV